MGTVTHNVNTLEDFEGVTSPSFANFGGSGPGAGSAAGLQYEGSESGTRRIAVTSTDAGFHVTLDSITEDFLASTSRIWWVKAMTALSGGITAEGTKVHVGHTTGNQFSYQIGDDGTMGGGKFVLPPKGGYVLIPIEVRVNAWRNLPNQAGSPDVGICDVFSMQHNVIATTGAGLSQSLDAIHTSGDGLFLVGSTSVFADFLAADEGEGVAGCERVGMWTSQAGALFVYGKHVIGRTDAGVSTLTAFDDSLQTLVFPGGFLSDGGNQFEIDLDTVSTAVTWTNITIIGQGRTRKIVHFDTELDVNATADDVDILGYGLEAGDQIFYFANGGSEDIGPDATSNEDEFAAGTSRGTTGPYWYVIKTDDDIINISATADDAYGASPTNEALTPSTAGNGERHTLIRAPSTVPYLLVTGNTGTFDMLNCSVIGGGVFTFTSTVTVTGGTYVGCDLIIMGGCEIDGATFITPTPGISEEFIRGTATDIDSATNGLKNCAFTSSGEGHGVKITSGSGAVALTGNTFTGYFDNDEDNTGGWAFEADTDVTGGATDTITITGHGFATGDPIHYSDEGGTTIVGLVDNDLYFIRSVDVNTVALYLTHRAATDDANRLDLTAGSAETHKLYSANAAVWNDTGLAVTLNIGGGGSGPSVRNTSGSTTLVVNTVTITITVVDQAGDPVENAQVWTAEGTDRDNPGSVLDNGDTNASGVRSFSFEFASPQPILISIRKSSTGADRFVPVETSGTIDAGGFALRRTLATDVNVLP
jgi:hypothetical protein